VPGVEKKRKEKKRKEKTTPFSVNFNSMRSQVLYWAAQGFVPSAQAMAV